MCTKTQNVESFLPISLINSYLFKITLSINLINL